MTSLPRINIDIEGEPSTGISGYVTVKDREILVNVISGEDGWITVEAWQGEPFEHPHYGTTAIATIRPWFFKPAFEKPTNRPKPQPKPRKLTLLELAIAAAKDQWRVGEVVYIWGTQQHGAYLRNVDSFVDLFVTGCQKGISVFILDMQNNCWVQAPNLEKHYQDWMLQLKAQQVPA